jgi:hypothetical protein
MAATMSDKPDDLVTLTYFSSARRELDDAALMDLLNQARICNARDEITGLLLYHRANFVQALEGPRDRVTPLFDRIRNDPRHMDIIPTSAQPIAERQFPNWHMGFVPSSRITFKHADTVASLLDQPTGGGAGPEGSVAMTLLRSFRDRMAR